MKMWCCAAMPQQRQLDGVKCTENCHRMSVMDQNPAVAPIHQGAALCAHFTANDKHARTVAQDTVLYRLAPCIACERGA